MSSGKGGEKKASQMQAYPICFELLAPHAPEYGGEHRNTDDIAEEAKFKGMKFMPQQLDHNIRRREQNGADRYPDDAPHVSGQTKPFARPFIRTAAVCCGRVHDPTMVLCGGLAPPLSGLSGQLSKPFVTHKSASDKQ